jgi:REP element-mobilizing transposase RayT
MNRGVGGRPIFERPDDYRYFQLLMACAVRSSRLLLHAFALMSNHYHLLVQSLDGNIGETMRRIQALYAGRFNRTRDTRRPGHLFGARFKSFPIRGNAYLFTAATYIDYNPVKAGLCRTPWAYPHGSARRLLLPGQVPRWLCAKTMDRLLAPHQADGGTRIQAYARLHAGSSALDALDVLARCLDGRAPTEGMDIDELLGGTQAIRRTWLEKMARQADGTRISMPVVHPRNVVRVLDEGGAWERTPLLPRGRSLSLRDVLEIGLLRDLAGMDYRSIGELIGLSRSAAAKRYDRHRRAMQEDATYGDVAASIAASALRQCYGPHATTLAQQVCRRRVSPRVVEST